MPKPETLLLVRKTDVEYQYCVNATSVIAVAVEPHSTQVIAASNTTTTENGVGIASPKTRRRRREKRSRAESCDHQSQGSAGIIHGSGFTSSASTKDRR